MQPNVTQFNQIQPNKNSTKFSTIQHNSTQFNPNQPMQLNSTWFNQNSTKFNSI